MWFFTVFWLSFCTAKGDLNHTCNCRARRCSLHFIGDNIKVQRRSVMCPGSQGSLVVEGQSSFHHPVLPPFSLAFTYVMERIKVHPGTPQLSSPFGWNSKIPLWMSFTLCTLFSAVYKGYRELTIHSHFLFSLGLCLPLRYFLLLKITLTQVRFPARSPPGTQQNLKRCRYPESGSHLE